MSMVISPPQAAQKLPKRVSLRFMIATLFSLQVLAAVGLTAFFSLRSGQNSIRSLAQDLQSEVSDRVQDRIHTFLTVPPKVNQIIAGSFSTGDLQPDNLTQLERYFIQLHQSFDTVYHISFGSQTGNYVGVRRDRSGKAFEVLLLDQAKDPLMRTYRTDAQGKHLSLIASKPYDPRQRPWYQWARAQRQPSWTPIYHYFKVNPSAFTHTVPVFDRQNHLKGVLATDFDLADISRFLHSLKIARSGMAVILEPNGTLVATSTQEEIFVTRPDGVERLPISQSRTPMIAAAGKYLQTSVPNLATTAGDRQFTFQIQGKRYFLQLVPLQAEGGMNWLLAVLIPETDFTEQAQSNYRITLMLCLVMLIAATLVAFRTSRWVVQPILRLAEFATALSTGVLPQRNLETPESQRRDEIGDLERIFNWMAQELQESSTALEKSHQEMEQQVEQRTAAIRQTAAELSGLFAAMTELIFVMDPQGRYLKIAPTNPTLLYRPAQELLGKTLHDIFPTDQANLLLGYIRQALRSKRVITVEYSVEIQDAEVWCAASISPISDDSVIWVVRDISDRKRAEKALQLSEEKFAKAFRSSPNLIIMTTLTDDYLVEVNDSFLNVSAYSHGEVIGRTALELGFWVDLEARQVMLQQLRTEKSFSNQEYDFRTKSGEIRTGLLSAEVINISGVEYGLYVLNDITDRKRAEEALRIEQAKSEELLLNILPKAIADRLKQQQIDVAGEPGNTYIAEQFDEVTILFADIVGFTQLSNQISPTELVALLNRIFSVFDDLSERYGLEKIKTIGDAYMVVGGLPNPRPDHAEAIANMALDMQREICRFRTYDNQEIQIRIGINTGPVVAGVIGIKKFIYDLWGNTVNIASRMESQGDVGRIQVTPATYDRLKDSYLLQPRGVIEVKGQGEMTTYWLVGKQSDNGVVLDSDRDQFLRYDASRPVDAEIT